MTFRVWLQAIYGLRACDSVILGDMHFCAIIGSKEVTIYSCEDVAELDLG